MLVSCLGTGWGLSELLVFVSGRHCCIVGSSLRNWCIDRIPYKIAIKKIII